MRPRQQAALVDRLHQRQADRLAADADDLAGLDGAGIFNEDAGKLVEALVAHGSFKKGLDCSTGTGEYGTGSHRSLNVTQPATTTAPAFTTITYGQTPQQPLELDLFLPASRPTTPQTNLPGVPAVLFIHGGGWSGGNRRQFHWHAAQLAARGMVAASASYRLSKVAKYPSALDDCQLALRWLRQHAADYGIDPARIGVMGSSAGGHLVACLGVRDTRPRPRNAGEGDAPGEVDAPPELANVSSRAQCVVDVHGVHDLPYHVGKHLDKTCVEFIGGNLDDKRALWEDASPIRFIDEKTAPMLIIHDPKDTVVPYEDSVLFAHALIRAARPIEFMPTPGAGHGFVYSPSHEWTQRVWPHCVAWLERWLR